jgi:hypothetical protein
MTITAQSDSYSPTLFEAIENAFDAVWSTLYVHMDPGNPSLKNCKSRSAKRSG